MKQLLLALVAVFLASSAYAAPVTYGFYQGGYAENAFVAGYFVAEDYNHDGFIQNLSESGTQSNCTLPPCELLDYFMHFSGNSLVRPFTHDGLSSFHLWEATDIDNLLGVYFDMRGSTIPVGNYVPPSCVPNLDCTSFPVGFMASQNVTFFTDGSIDRGVLWRAGLLGDAGWCGEDIPLCGTISDQQGGSPTIGGFTTTTERIRIFAIAEPPPLTLIGIALVGLAFIRRRGDCREHAH